jgi:hypothetical protein
MVDTLAVEEGASLPHRNGAGPGIIGGPREGVASLTIVVRATRVVVLVFLFPLALTLAFATVVGSGAGGGGAAGEHDNSC